MTTNRKITLAEVYSCIITIRDRVLTDENLTTLEEVVKKMTDLLTSLYNGISDENRTTITTELTNRGLLEEKELINEISKNSFLTDLVTTVQKISLDGIIDAISFIKIHLKKTDDILIDLKELLTSFENIHKYKQQDNIEDETSTSRTIPSDLQELYIQLLPIL